MRIGLGVFRNYNDIQNIIPESIELEGQQHVEDEEKEEENSE